MRLRKSSDSFPEFRIHTDSRINSCWGWVFFTRGASCALARLCKQTLQKYILSSMVHILRKSGFKKSYSPLNCIPKPTKWDGLQRASWRECLIFVDQRFIERRALIQILFFMKDRVTSKKGSFFYSAATLSCRLNRLQHPGMVPCPWQHRLGCLWTQRETERGI